MNNAEPISLWLSIALGVVQGITEFLPISSDGHIAAFALLFGDVELPLSMTVLLHVGTLIATFLVFRKDVGELLASIWRARRAPRPWLNSEEGRTVIAILVVSLPTAIIGLMLKDSVEAWSHVAWIVGVCLLGTAVAVASTRWSAARWGDRASNSTALSYRNAILVGLAQGAAVLPGLSRSGSTIAVMMLLGTAAPAAFRMSFLMSLPAVLGAVLLELRHPVEVVETLGANALLGAVVSFFVGWASLHVLARIVASGRFAAFAFYLIPLGLFLIVWSIA